MTSRDFYFLLLGIVLLLTVKYIVFGLDNWDKWLHPNRIDNPNSIFYYPFFGWFND